MNKVLRVAAVSYLNTKPFLYGLGREEIREFFDVILTTPAQCADLLINNGVDIALIPIAALDQLKSFQFITSFGIAAEKQVASVNLFSRSPVENIQKIYLDCESRTSNALVKILAEEYWGVDSTYELPISSEMIILNDGEGKVLIGDKALRNQENLPFRYDLASAWFDFSGLPFVFARWVSKKEISEESVELLQKAFSFSLECLDQVIEEQKPNYPDVDIRNYLKENIQYQLTDRHQSGLELFLKKLEKNTQFAI